MAGYLTIRLNLYRMVREETIQKSRRFYWKISRYNVTNHVYTVAPCLHQEMIQITVFKAHVDNLNVKSVPIILYQTGHEGRINGRKIVG